MNDLFEDAEGTTWTLIRLPDDTELIWCDEDDCMESADWGVTEGATADGCEIGWFCARHFAEWRGDQLALEIAP